MDKVRISSGGPRANVRAGEDLPEDRVWKYSTTENEVTLCAIGEEADGICLSETLADSILNDTGVNYGRSYTGVFDNVTVSGSVTVGGEWMSGASGVIQAYSASGDRRPLGKVLKDYGDGTAKIIFYGN